MNETNLDRPLPFYRYELPGFDRSDLCPYDIGHVVYFLWVSQELLYIGQTVALARRLPEHGHKPWSHVTYLPFEDSRDAIEAETHLIRALEPPMNIQGVLSKGSKTFLAEEAIRRWPEMSDRKIASLIGVSHVTVSRARARNPREATPKAKKPATAPAPAVPAPAPGLQEKLDHVTRQNRILKDMIASYEVLFAGIGGFEALDQDGLRFVLRFTDGQGQFEVDSRPLKALRTVILDAD